MPTPSTDPAAPIALGGPGAPASSPAAAPPRPKAEPAAPAQASAGYKAPELPKGARRLPPHLVCIHDCALRVGRELRQYRAGQLVSGLDPGYGKAAKSILFEKKTAN